MMIFKPLMLALFVRVIVIGFVLLSEPSGGSPPKIPGLRTSESYRTYEHQSFVLFCEAQGFPAPSFRYINTSGSTWHSL
jgi:hypothetical protein